MEPSNPVQRSKCWLQEHANHMVECKDSAADTVFMGDSIMLHYQRYPHILNRYFKPFKMINFGISGDRTQHVLWRIKFGVLPGNTKLIVVHVGTNNVKTRNSAVDIAAAILNIATMLKMRNVHAQVVVTGLLPRGLYSSITKICGISDHLEGLIHKHAKQTVYLSPESNWVHPDGKLNIKFFCKDKLHLSEAGYRKFSLYILKVLASAPQSFVNSSISTYEYAIGEFEALSPPKSTIIQSSVHSHCTRTLLCQDNFPSILSNVGSLSSYLNLPTWPVFSAISLPFV